MQIFALFLAATSMAAPADLVIENARIWTPAKIGFASFAAVQNGRFVHVGTREAAYVGPNTVRVDAKGRVVIPGLIDAHIHMLGGGTNLSQLQLRDAKDRPDFVAKVEAWTKTLAPGKWVLGGRWTVDSWADKSLPAKEWIDAATGERPLYLARMDGHSALVNSAALKLAGIDQSGPANPEGGVIDRGPGGEPTSILRESAMGLVARHIHSTSLNEKVEALVAAFKEANRHGITSVGDVLGGGDLAVYERLAPERQTVRLNLYPILYDVAASSDRLKGFKTREGWTQIRGFKAYFDGSLGSRTAYMHEPFLGNAPDRPQWRGLLREGIEDGRFKLNAAAAQALGLQTIAHAIGDEANDLLLNTLVSTYSNLKTARCRSEHAQHLLPQDVPRFGQLGVIASMQPLHKADDGRYAESYLGPQRIRSSYAFKSLLAGGATLAFGSDWPVVSLNPFLGVEAAVTGLTLDGKLWQPQENLTVAQALTAYTGGAAYGLFADKQVGRIAPGMRADFVILNADPFAQGVAWKKMAPVSTYVEGKLVYEAR